MNKEDVTMKQIIKFVDKNVDGCGTNVEILIQIEEKNPLSTELVDAVKLPTAQIPDEILKRGLEKAI